MQTKEMALAVLVSLSLISGTAYLLTSDTELSTNDEILVIEDPLIQEEGHDHMDASMHNMSSGNIEQISYNPLTNGGNAEVTVADSPDGRNVDGGAERPSWQRQERMTTQLRRDGRPRRLRRTRMNWRRRLRS